MRYRVVPEMRRRSLPCLLRLGHKWQKSVSHGTPFFRCVRCGREREPSSTIVEMMRRPWPFE
jgi:hypothetical protein